jgi:excinuclease ABC subunit C
MNLKEKVKQLPLSPGVYIMKDHHGIVIYVGKAKSLKKRVQTYFQNTASHPQKIKKMVANIDDFDYILTDTEFEAFMLECKLIKEWKPLFNKRMKSHLSYSYLAINMEGPYRKIYISAENTEGEGILYFGPYTSPIYVKKAIENLKEYFHINCLHPLMGSPCLNYTLGKCNGLCLGGVAVDKYNAIFDKIIALLQGKDRSILEELEQKMMQASEGFDFEAAGRYRNYLKSFSILLYKESLIQFTEDNKNIAVIEHLDEGTLKLFLLKGHKIIYSEKFSAENSKLGKIIGSNILTHFRDLKHKDASAIGKEDLDEAQIMYSYLNGSRSKFMIIPDEWIDSVDNVKLDEAIVDLIQND